MSHTLQYIYPTQLSHRGAARANYGQHTARRIQLHQGDLSFRRETTNILHTRTSPRYIICSFSQRLKPHLYEQSHTIPHRQNAHLLHILLPRPCSPAQSPHSPARNKHIRIPLHPQRHVLRRLKFIISYMGETRPARQCRSLLRHAQE